MARHLLFVDAGGSSATGEVRLVEMRYPRRAAAQQPFAELVQKCRCGRGDPPFRSLGLGVQSYGAVVAPLLLLPLLQVSGPISMLAVIAATLLGRAVLLVVAPSGLQRRTVA